MYYIKIATLIFLYSSAMLLTWWLFFRPGAKKFYESCSKIPLKTILKHEEEGKGER
jgi:hypothetical protein